MNIWGFFIFECHETCQIMKLFGKNVLSLHHGALPRSSGFAEPEKIGGTMARFNTGPYEIASEPSRFIGP